MDSLPRTLVVTEAPFGLNNGFGVTLNTFFSGWDTERLFVLYTRQETAGSSEQNGRSAFASVPGHWGRRYGAAFLLGRRPTWRGRYSAWPVCGRAARSLFSTSVGSVNSQRLIFREGSTIRC